jgi:hypothetical protein
MISPDRTWQLSALDYFSPVWLSLLRLHVETYAHHSIAVSLMTVGMIHPECSRKLTSESGLSRQLYCIQQVRLQKDSICNFELMSSARPTKRQHRRHDHLVVAIPALGGRTPQSHRLRRLAVRSTSAETTPYSRRSRWEWCCRKTSWKLTSPVRTSPMLAGRYTRTCHPEPRRINAVQLSLAYGERDGFRVHRPGPTTKRKIHGTDRPGEPSSGPVQVIGANQAVVFPTITVINTTLSESASIQVPTPSVTVNRALLPGSDFTYEAGA